ncbi:phosphotransferase enzyme family protein [Clostridium beijerinckii]|nr:phosphotransferase [Clostridium beijerinckii]
MALESIDIFNRLANEALKYYAMHENSIAKILQISENITYLVTNLVTGEKNVMRIGRPGYHTKDELDAELIWLKEIKENTPLVVAGAVKGMNGEYVHEVACELSPNKKYYCVMYEFLEGNAPSEDDEENVIRQFINLGEVTGYLHKQVKTWNNASKLKRFIWDYDSMLGTNPRWGKWQNAADINTEIEKLLTRTSKTINKRLINYGKGKDKFGLIHADLRLANLLIEGEQMKVIDFDDCGYGWFMHDMAASISFIEDKPIAKELIDSWIEGYSKVQKLQKEDINEIDTFIMQRRLQLMAWLASHHESDPVIELSKGFTEGTAVLAEKYLEKYA